MPCSMDSEVEQLHSHAKSLVEKSKQEGENSHIEEAIAIDNEALERCPPGHPKRAASLALLASHLYDRYRQLGATRDLDVAIVLGREALDLRPQGHPDRFTSLNNLAGFLVIRFNELGTIQDLNEAIPFGKEALDLCSQGHRHRQASNLRSAVSARFKLLGEMQDLNDVIVLGRAALELSPERHPHRLESLDSLAADLATRHNHLGAVQDINEAIILSREALELREKGHPDRSLSLNNLALFLFTRCKQLVQVQDLDEAIALSREALDLSPQGHPRRSTSLNNLAVDLTTRYNQLGRVQDLNEAINFGREALDAFPQGHPYRCTSLNNLSGHLLVRYGQLGAVEDINEVIMLSRESLDLCPQGHPNRSSFLSNLARPLSARFKYLNALQDLSEAIGLDQEALQLHPQGHPDRSRSLANLATSFFAWHKQGEEIQHLNLAILLDREALDLRPQGHLDRPVSLNNLSVRLSARYRHLGEIRDLNDAIVLRREALDLFPQGHPYRPMTFGNLANDLFIRYKKFREMQDINDAIVLGRKGLELYPQGHPSRSVSLESLASYLSIRLRESMEVKDKEEVFNLYTQLGCVTEIVSPNDLAAARGWISAAEEFQHPTLLLAYETSLRLLVHRLATLPTLPQYLVIFRKLVSSLAVDAFSACLRNHSPSKAVELLEQGRGVFWSQLSRLRSPLEDVIASGPTGKTLADEFSRLAALTRNALGSTGANQHEQVHRLNLDMQNVVAKIRELPGLSRFLLPSLFSDLQCAAKEGPVIVVNASKYSCDALVIALDRDPVHVPLQITQGFVRDLATELRALTKRATKDDVTKQMAFFLRKLWDSIVGPVVDVLRTTVPTRSRIWWCPTAEFSQLPLHAAGPFRKGQQNIPELYISSYTPTLTALIRARQSDPSDSAAEQKRFLAIGQGNAIGEGVLPSVGLELDTIDQRISGLAAFTRIEGETSCITRVVEEFSRNEWVHFSCHGLPNRTQPFDSAFALWDGHFTIQRIIGCDLKNPEFAYLSACHTTVGDAESPDEVIHLASAMQFAGFRSVIGTMWAVDDDETAKVTSTFYKHMVDMSGRLDHTRAAMALNKTMRSVNVPFDQRVLYIHLGA